MVKYFLMFSTTLLIVFVLANERVQSAPRKSHSVELNDNQQREIELLKSLLRHQHADSNEEFEDDHAGNYFIAAEKRFPKWRGSKVNSRNSLTKFNSNYGKNNEIRKIWDNTLKMKNKIYEKNNLLDY